MVEALPKDCIDWLTSRKAVNRAGEQYRQDPSNYAVLRKVQCYRLFQLCGLDSALDAVVGSLPRFDVLVAARLKRLPTIVRKLQRQPEMQLSRMADVIGLRVICSSYAAAREIRESLIRSEIFVRELNYWDQARDSGYRACHLLFRQEREVARGGLQMSVDFEVQIRTYFQHLWSLVSESFGERVKEGGGPQAISAYLRELSTVIRHREDGAPSDRQIDFPELPQDRGLLVVHFTEGGEPTSIPFGHDYERAVSRLFAWEESLDGAPGDTLLLLGVGDLGKLGLTHASFLGMKRIPLPSWMPALNVDDGSTMA